jgi:hypothetical protein
MTVELHHALLDEPHDLNLLPDVSFSIVQVKLPDTGDDPNVPSKWLAGIYTLSIRVQKPGLPPWTSNAVPFALAPQLTLTAPPGGTTTPGNITIGLDCIPQVHHTQRDVLIFGDREVQLGNLTTPGDPAAPSTLTFLVQNAAEGEYVLRLRIDGVDSIPVDFSATPPEFAADQKVIITP